MKCSEGSASKQLSGRDPSPAAQDDKKKVAQMTKKVTQDDKRKMAGGQGKSGRMTSEKWLEDKEKVAG